MGLFVVVVYVVCVCVCVCVWMFDDKSFMWIGNVHIHLTIIYYDLERLKSRTSTLHAHASILLFIHSYIY